MSDDADRDIERLMSGEPEWLKKETAAQVRHSGEMPIEARDSGALTRAEEETGIRAGKMTRRVALGVFIAGITVKLYEESGTLASWLQVQQNERSYAKADFNISRSFADHIAKVDYWAEDPAAGYAGTLTDGERAVVDSMSALRSGKLHLLPGIHLDLETAAQVSTSHDAKAIALSRLAIDSSFRGEAKPALDALSRLDWNLIRNDGTVMRLLDFGTSVALNAATDSCRRSQSSGLVLANGAISCSN